VGSVDVTPDGPPRIGCAYAYGCAPADDGRVTGRHPDGETAPVRIRAIAVPPSSPGKNDCSTAPGFSSAQPIAYGLPVSSTVTTGVPVATTRSTSSRWRPGRSSEST